MGVNKHLWELEQRTLENLGIGYRGIRLLEFGSLVHRVMKKPAKIVYEKMGVIHRSIDLNGKYGSVRLDLCNPIPEKFLNLFNLVTNYGTIEHINNQYQAFKNAHDALVIGGIAIHGFPKVGTFKNHCRYYYDIECVKLIGKICRYKIIEIGEFDLTRDNDGYLSFMVYVVFQKKGHKFPSEDKFPLYSIHDTEDIRRTGDYH